MPRLITEFILRALQLVRVGRLPPQPDARPRRIALLRFGGIGDIVVLTGLARTLKQLYPGSRITLVTGPEGVAIAEANDDIDDVIEAANLQLENDPARTIANLRTMRALSGPEPFDLAILTHSDINRLFCTLWLKARNKAGFDVNARGFDFALTHAWPLYVLGHPLMSSQAGLHLNDQFHAILGAYLGHPVTPSPPRLELRPGERSWAKTWLAEQGLKHPIIALSPGGSDPIKHWPIGRWLDVVRGCRDRLGASVLLLGGPTERPLGEPFAAAGAVSAAGTLTLRQTMSIIGQIDAIAGNDTGLIHVAAALGIPSVALFGPSDAVVFGYQGPDRRILRADLPCVPCKISSCRLLPPHARGRETPPCLDAITIEHVVRALGEVTRHHAPVAS
jgi:heptosyltransferase-2